jgi:hypothetical protein
VSRVSVFGAEFDPSNIIIAVAGPMDVIRKNASPEERVLLEGRR